MSNQIEYCVKEGKACAHTNQIKTPVKVAHIVYIAKETAIVRNIFFYFALFTPVFDYFFVFLFNLKSENINMLAKDKE